MLLLVMNILLIVSICDFNKEILEHDLYLSTFGTLIDNSSFFRLMKCQCLV